MDLAQLKSEAFATLQGLFSGTIAPHEDAQAQAMHPVGHVTGGADVAEIWHALRRALPDGERRDDIFLAGENHPDPRAKFERFGPLVACMGSYQGTFSAPLFGIPPSHGVVTLRYGEAHYFEDGRLLRSWLIWDLADLLLQVGRWPLAAPLGAPGHWPGPKGGGGVLLDRAGPADALTRVFAMHDALLSFDGKSLDSMPMSDWWTENFMYYAGGGIGTTRGLAGFRAHHQIPFLHAFPDRYAIGHFIRIGDGDFAVTGGDVGATHTGEYLGMAPTGRPIKMSVMDFYRFDGDRIAENWLPIDILGLAAQMGVDVLARVAHHAGAPRRTL